MTYSGEATIDAFLPSATALFAGAFDEALPTADLSTWNGRRACADYSEEAIPERDPAYRLSGGTPSETLTVEHLSAAQRLALVRCLEQLGMSRARAAAVASL